MGLDTLDLEKLRLGKGGVQHAAQPHTMKACVGGFVNTVLDVATGKRAKKKKEEKKIMVG